MGGGKEDGEGEGGGYRGGQGKHVLQSEIFNDEYAKFLAVNWSADVICLSANIITLTLLHLLSSLS